ncbi:MAG: hypothetical protein QF464_10755 [Myxococcota bacterium]|nr:hypothetical protein [Myxococcota bacterium]
MTSRAQLIAAFACLCACGEPLPADIADYASTCVRLNTEELPPYPDDPHDGYKTVFACHATLEDIVARDYPDGAIVVKESRKPGQDYPFLIATARKDAGQWSWAEYTRNFESESFVKLPIAEAVCIDCHQAYADWDWIMTGYDGASP